MKAHARRIVAARAGGPEVLRLETFAAPDPGAGDVRIRNEACGVAFADVLLRQGLYPGQKLPATPGYEVVGRIEACGAGVDEFAAGDYVAALTVVGGYASHAIVPAGDLVRVPDPLSAETAAALVLNGVTALQLIERCCPADVASVAIFGAAGGVGSILLDIARYKGLTTYGFGGRAKHAAIAAKGATPLERTDPVAALRAVAPGGVDVVIDGVGMSNVKRSLAMTREGGTVVVYGAQSVLDAGRKNYVRMAREWAAMPRWSALSVFEADRGVVGYNISGRKRAKPEHYRADLATIFALAVSGAIVPTIDRVFDLSEAAAAHARIDGGEHIGKIVLRTAS